MIVFIGVPGVGKTTIARLVANKLGLTSVDSDELIEAQVGLPIADIFATKGEAEFRRIEEDVVADALSGNGVLALGGGAIKSERTRKLLVGHDVVWLTAALTTVVDRVGLKAARPLLLGNVRGKLAELARDREPLYREAATMIVGTDDRNPDEIANLVIAGLEPQ